MSDISQGPGWWVASDGKWYPPETHPDYSAPPEVGATASGESPGGDPDRDPEAPGDSALGSVAGSVPGSLPGGRSGARRVVIVAVVAVVVVLVIAGIVAVVVSSTKSTSSALQGPPSTASPHAVSVAVNFVRSDVPANWHSNDEGGRCITGREGTPSKTGCGGSALPASVRADTTLARCLGLPLSRVSMLTANDEPGEPYTFSSSTYSAPSSAPADSEAADETPQAQSFSTLDSSESQQASDLSAFAKPTFVPCWGGWFKGSLKAAGLEGLSSSLGIKLSLSTPVIRPRPIPSTSGVHAVAYTLALTLQASSSKLSTLNFRESLRAEAVILGAGRLEVVLDLSGSASKPFPTSLASTLIKREETRLARAAAG